MATNINDAACMELDAIRREMNKINEEAAMAAGRNEQGDMDLATLGRLTAIRQLLARATEKFRD